MFGKISDKTKREAYISAVTQANEKEPAIVSRQNYLRRNARNDRIVGRRVVSGKEANDLAKKEIKISVKTDKRAIIDNKLANMKYYDDWRDRVDGEILNEPIKDEAPSQVEQKPTSTSAGPLNFDSLDHEPGIGSDSLTNSNSSANLQSSKSFLDGMFPDSTREEGPQEESLFDRLFKRSQERAKENTAKEAQNQSARKEYETRTSFINRHPAPSPAPKREEPKPVIPVVEEKAEELDDEEDDFNLSDFLSRRASETKAVSKKRGPYKKKKKIDADIIGATGFFTIS